MTDEMTDAMTDAITNPVVDQASTTFEEELETLNLYDKELDLMPIAQIEAHEDDIDNKWENLELISRRSYKKYLEALGDFTVPLRDLRFIILFCSVHECRLFHLIPRKMCTRLIISKLHYHSGDHLLFFVEPTGIFCRHLRQAGFSGVLHYEWEVSKDANSVKAGLDLYYHYTNVWKNILENRI